MAYITADELATHIYPEVMGEIVRDNMELVDKSITAAISKAKMHLSRFDLLKLFGNTVTPAIVDDENLKNLVKDIACWLLVKLSNANINLELFRTVFEDAIKEFEKIQKGGADPEGWPYKQDDPETPGNENTTIQYSSNPKRNQHF